MYVRPNFKTKKELRERVKQGTRVEVFQPGPFPAQTEGRVSVEGPHYPQPHTWYAVVEVKNGVVVKVIS